MDRDKFRLVEELKDLTTAQLLTLLTTESSLTLADKAVVRQILQERRRELSVVEHETFLDQGQSSVDDVKQSSAEELHQFDFALQEAERSLNELLASVAWEKSTWQVDRTMKNEAAVIRRMTELETNRQRLLRNRDALLQAVSRVESEQTMSELTAASLKDAVELIVRLQQLGASVEVKIHNRPADEIGAHGAPVKFKNPVTRRLEREASNSRYQHIETLYRQLDAIDAERNLKPDDFGLIERQKTTLAELRQLQHEEAADIERHILNAVPLDAGAKAIAEAEELLASHADSTPTDSVTE